MRNKVIGIGRDEFCASFSFGDTRVITATAVFSSPIEVRVLQFTGTPKQCWEELLAEVLTKGVYETLNINTQYLLVCGVAASWGKNFTYFVSEPNQEP